MFSLRSRRGFSASFTAVGVVVFFKSWLNHDRVYCCMNQRANERVLDQHEEIHYVQYSSTR